MVDDSFKLTSKNVLLWLITAGLLMAAYLLFQSGEGKMGSKPNHSLPDSSLHHDPPTDQPDLYKEEESGLLTPEMAKELQTNTRGTATATDNGLSETLPPAVEFPTPLPTSKSPVEGGGIIIQLDDRHLNN